MNKEFILKKLSESTLDKNRIIIISGASLVIQDIISETSDIDLACDKDYYDTLNWKTKIGAYGTEIKYNDIFEISPNLFFPNKIEVINNYKLMNLQKCLEIKKCLNRKKDKDIINLLEDYLDKKKH